MTRVRGLRDEVRGEFSRGGRFLYICFCVVPVEDCWRWMVRAVGNGDAHRRVIHPVGAAATVASRHSFSPFPA